MPCSRASVAQLAEQLPADAAALPLVDDLEGDLGLGRVRVADEARQADGAPGGLVDRDDGFAPAAADVDEPVDVTLGEARLRAEEAQPATPLGEAGEDVEHRLPLPVAERSEGDCIHASQRASVAQSSAVRLSVLHEAPRCSASPSSASTSAAIVSGGSACADLARLLEQLAVVGDPGEAEVGEARLARAERARRRRGSRDPSRRARSRPWTRPSPRAARARSRSAPPSIPTRRAGSTTALPRARRGRAAGAAARARSDRPPGRS